MRIDDLFTANESGRSSSILAENTDERLSFDSFYDWRDYNIQSLKYPMMVSFLMPKGMTVENLIDTIDSLMKWTNRFYDAYTVRYSNEFGIQRVDDLSDNGAIYLSRFVDFNRDPINYIKFVFWLTHFHYELNIKNFEYTKQHPFNNFRMLFSTNEKEFFSSAQVLYSDKIQVLRSDIYEANLMYFIISDVLRSHYLDDKLFRKIDNKRLLRWVDRMRSQFRIKRESHVSDIFSMIKKIDNIC